MTYPTYPYQLAFKSFIENDPILYSMLFENMMWGDIEDAENNENNENKEIFENFVII